jgi:uncharacterized protein YjiS (DUF1127 family)
MNEDPRLVRAWDEQTKVRKALRDLLDQIALLEDVIFSKDIERYKAEACWNDAMDRARDAL